MQLARKRAEDALPVGACMWGPPARASCPSCVATQPDDRHTHLDAALWGLHDCVIGNECVHQLLCQQVPSAHDVQLAAPRQLQARAAGQQGWWSAAAGGALQWQNFTGSDCTGGCLHLVYSRTAACSPHASAPHPSLRHQQNMSPKHVRTSGRHRLRLRAASASASRQSSSATASEAAATSGANSARRAVSWQAMLLSMSWQGGQEGRHGGKEGLIHPNRAAQ